MQPATYASSALLGGGAFAFVLGFTQQTPTQPVGVITVDPMIIAGAVVFAISAIGSVAVQIINARANAKERELAATERAKIALQQEAVMEKAEEIKAQQTSVLAKVDGNYSDLKAEVSAAKAEVVQANQRIAVLVERLITSTPATAAPAPPTTIVLNGVPSTP